jgi:hypothetical protein
METNLDSDPETKSKQQTQNLADVVPDLLKFNTFEKLFILTIDDEQESETGSKKYTLCYGLAGAIMAELALVNKIQLQKGRLILSDVSPTGDGLMDEVLETIAVEKKPRKLSRWIYIIGRKQLVNKVAVRVAERNVIRFDKKHYTWIIPFENDPTVDASAKYSVKQRLRGIVLAGEKAYPSDIALLGQLKQSRLLRLLFTKDERLEAINKVDALVKDAGFDDMVKKLLTEIHIAVVAAVASASS